MMDLFLNNKWSIRIIALILAAILFISVHADNNGSTQIQTSSQTDTEVIQNVPVEVYYDKENLYVSGVPETVTVTITGPRSIVQNAKAQQDFTVYVDLRNASIGEQNVKLQIKDLSDRVKATISPDTATVNVQEKVTKKFSVDVELGQSVVAAGYEAGTPEVSPKKVSITGAKDTIDQIAYVKATIDDSGGHKEDFTAEAEIVAFDSKLNKLDVEIDPQKVEVTVPVNKVGKSVPLTIKQTGSPPDDLSISSITPDRDEVVVIGDDEVLDKINKIELSVDVSNITADTVKEITIPVPEGATSVQPSTVEVKIKTAKKSSNDSSDSQSSTTDSTTDQGSNTNDTSDDSTNTDISKTFSDVSIAETGLKDDLTATLTSPSNGKVSVTVKGPSSTVNGLSSSSFKVIADLSKATEGENYSAKLAINNLPSDVSYTLSQTTAKYTITKKSATDT
ncbi:YbbR-like domain-containing protein [Listeria costaricensis]|uniref:CdaR family protein n=1 Tax=Listeria costaricensis TaxID=2026604 RepID=UPI000C080136|nr:CdaR family protein [Listeria costaricensis]